MNKEKQQELVSKITRAYSDPTFRAVALAGADLALGDAAPPHWIINLECNRTDRIFNQNNKTA